ncbi:MAG: hypothetical protein HY220_04195 [Candidatus Sungbacteria bacterium]|uniref:Uncharacterized protein n=1 Tax=Candidatus Sungiibacteriota bacterium TaxID=2750080 RepID=A0A9D6QVW4_9BACT|nr:hypothetical protein [Candidatus Sungbacteria bacterium]
MSLFTQMAREAMQNGFLELIDKYLAKYGNSPEIRRVLEGMRKEVSKFDVK